MMHFYHVQTHSSTIAVSAPLILLTIFTTMHPSTSNCPSKDFLFFPINHRFVIVEQKQAQCVCLLSKQKTAFQAFSFANMKLLCTNITYKLDIYIIDLYNFLTFDFTLSRCSIHSSFFKLANETSTSQAHSYENSRKGSIQNKNYWQDVKSQRINLFTQDAFYKLCHHFCPRKAENSKQRELYN